MKILRAFGFAGLFPQPQGDGADRRWVNDGSASGNDTCWRRSRSPEPTQCQAGENVGLRASGMAMHDYGLSDALADRQGRVPVAESLAVARNRAGGEAIAAVPAAAEGEGQSLRVHVQACSICRASQASRSEIRISRRVPSLIDAISLAASNS